jgi:hypothetical protein
MTRFSILAVCLAGCGADNQRTPDGGDMQSPIDATEPIDGAVPIDMVVGGACPCVKGNYCDPATNTCQAGCALNTDCNAGQSCDTPTHKCYTPCGGQMCQASEICCPNSGSPMCALFCPTDMSVITGTCTGPADCGGGMPICCVNFTLGALPSCPKSATLQCESTCNTVLPQTTCLSMGSAVVCKQKSDCIDSQYPNCCSLPQFFTGGNICVSNGDATGATCVN